MAAGECRVSAQEIMQAQRAPIMCAHSWEDGSSSVLVLHPGFRYHGHRTLTGQAQARAKLSPIP
jgi:hypothetical protein